MTESDRYSPKVEAARRLGYANQRFRLRQDRRWHRYKFSTALDGSESGTDATIAQIDYIDGDLNDDWELSTQALQERDMAKWMMEAMGSRSRSVIQKS